MFGLFQRSTGQEETYGEPFPFGLRFRGSSLESVGWGNRLMVPFDNFTVFICNLLQTVPVLGWFFSGLGMVRFRVMMATGLVTQNRTNRVPLEYRAETEIAHDRFQTSPNREPLRFQKQGVGTVEPTEGIEPRRTANQFTRPNDFLEPTNQPLGIQLTRFWPYFNYTF